VIVRAFALLIFSVLIALTGGRAPAAERQLVVVNAGNEAIFSVRLGNEARHRWSPDLLRFDQVIDVSSGRQLRVPYDRSVCRYDVQATYAAGAVAALHNVNLCRSDAVTFRR